MQDAEVENHMDTIDFISPDRLKTYEKQTDNTKRAIALHNHTLQLGSSLMSMIALFELSLRNATNTRLSHDFGDADWLVEGKKTLPLKTDEQRHISKAISQARKAAYAKLSYPEKSKLDELAFPNGVPHGMKHAKIVKARQALFDVSHGQIIAQTTLAFWKRLYSGEYENTLWRPSLKRVFPDKSLKRSEISTALEHIYATRNRVAHHEPVYGNRLEEVMRAVAFLRNTLGASKGDENTTFQRFSRVHHLRLRMDYESFIEAWDTLT